MKLYRRILAALLCAVLCFSLLPAWASAEEEPIPDELVFPEESVEDHGSGEAAENVVEEEPVIEDSVPEGPSPEVEAAWDDEEEIVVEESAFFPEDSGAASAEGWSSLGEETGEAFETEEIELSEEYCDADAPDDSSQLLQSYFEKELGMIRLRGPLNPTQTLTPQQATVYESLLPLIRETASGQRNSTVYMIASERADAFTWTAEELGYTTINSENARDAAAQALESYISIEQIHRALMNVCPFELYWYDKTVGVSVSYTFYYKRDGKTLSVYKLRYVFAVASEYSDGQTETHDSKVYRISLQDGIGETITAAANNANSIIGSCTAVGDLARLKYYRDAICARVSYNTPAAEGEVPYGNPWQVIWVFDDDPETKVVCEGYAKAFQLLCDRTRQMGLFASSFINCLSVSGKMNGENHMWNLVTMDNRLNYLVDVTNCDQGSYGSDRRFLRGSANQGENRYLIDSSTYAYDSNAVEYYTAEELQLAFADYPASGQTLFDRLKEAAADETVHYFDLSGLGEYVLPEDLPVRGDFFIDTDGTMLVVPAGVCMTVRDRLETNNLRVEGELAAQQGSVNILDRFSLSGTLILDASDADLPSEGFPDDRIFENVSLTGDSEVNLRYSAVNADSAFSALTATHALPDRFRGTVSVLFPWTLDRNLTLREKATLIVDGAWNDGSLVVPEGTTLTLYSDLTVQGNALTVQGGLVNRASLKLTAVDSAQNPNFGGLVVDGGCYSGDGTIAVATTADPEACLTGLDLGRFKRSEMDGWTLFSGYLEPVSFKASLATESAIHMNILCGLPEGQDPADYSVRLQYDSPYQTIDETRPFTSLGTRYGQYILAPAKHPGATLQAGSDEMTFDMNITVFRNGEIVAIRTFSIRDIAEEKLQIQDLDPKLDTLYRALLQYGYYAQLEFGTRTYDLPDKDMAPPLERIPDSYATSDDTSALAGVISNIRFSLPLDSAVDMNVRITPAAGYNLNDFEIIVTGKNGNEKYTKPVMSGGLIYFRIYSIYADQMGDACTIELRLKSDPAKKAVWTRSLNSCAYNLQEADKYVDVMQAMYQYSEASSAYWKSVL